MSVSGSEKVVGIARRVKRFLRNPKKVLQRRLWGRKEALKRKNIRSKKQEFRQVKNEIKRRKQELPGAQSRKINKRERRELLRAQSKKIKSNKLELSLLRKRNPAATEQAEVIGHKQRKKRLEHEIFQLEREFRALKEGRTEGEPVTGALPDFLVIGGKKCGTTFLYHLLTQHPLVQHGAKKELHFFDALFDEGIEWYRQCFPVPSWNDGRRTISGEATPYMANRPAPQRVARIVPQARLIALLRNPIDRAYSDYQMGLRKEREPRTFEEALGMAEKVRSSGREGGEVLQREDRLSLDRNNYLSRSVYVDQLMRWREFFPREQMLVLKSEDFFERPQETLNTVFSFLDLPQWEPEASEIKPKKRNKGSYEQGISGATRQYLEEYFEPHNRRLYEFLGTDLGW